MDNKKKNGMRSRYDEDMDWLDDDDDYLDDGGLIGSLLFGNKKKKEKRQRQIKYIAEARVMVTIGAERNRCRIRNRRQLREDSVLIIFFLNGVCQNVDNAVV